MATTSSREMPRIAAGIASLLLLAAPAVQGQGRDAAPIYGGQFANYEYPHTKPITVFRSSIDGHDYLAVCNTPDNSLELFDTQPASGSSPTFVARVPTGLDPVSVVFNPADGKLYTCNMLGDSVSIIVMEAGTNGRMRPRLERNVPVGDEPAHLVFWGAFCFVTLHSQASAAVLDAATLAPFVPVPVPLAHQFNRNPSGPPDIVVGAVKEPRAVMVFQDRLFALGSKGTHRILPGVPANFDIFTFDLLTGATGKLAQLGTGNFNMAFDSGGDLYVVGAEAQNINQAILGNLGEVAMSQVDTGFVTTLLTRVVAPGSPAPTREVRDLNRAPGGAPVAPAASLAFAVDILAFETSGPSAQVKLYVASLNSDNVGVITNVKNLATTPPTRQPASAWNVTAIAMPSPGPGGMAGPSGLALKRANPAVANDPGDRLYALRRFDSRITVINPDTDQVVGTAVALNNDPTPEHILLGRPFLYSSRFSIDDTVVPNTGGFNSCFSCHHFGRLDDQQWDLGVTPDSDVFHAFLDGGITDPMGLAALKGNIPMGQTEPHFPGTKSFIITQSLQGLLNWEVDPLMQVLFTNEPYHWRGDRSTFLAFRGAFRGLLGGPPIATTPPTPNTVTADKMILYRNYINSILYPPNPEQPKNRKYSGAFGTPGSESDGTLARRGLKLYHTRPVLSGGAGAVCAGRSCVQCHELPDGSDNVCTELEAQAAFGFGLPRNPAIGNPLETAALRGIAQKETLLLVGRPDVSGVATDPNNVWIDNFAISGLDHLGRATSINDFIFATFPLDFAGTNDLRDLTAYVRELDTGTAPSVGRSFSIRSNTSNPATTLMEFEEQVRVANAGLAVQSIRVTAAGLTQRGFVFDRALTTPAYREIPTGATLSRTQLLALIQSANDTLVATATPLGSERRIASPTGRAPAQTSAGTPPTLVRLESMVPNTANEDIPSLTKNWRPGLTANDFMWSPQSPMTATPEHLKRTRLFQYGVGLGTAAAPLRHEAPRRLRVSGQNIRLGAKLAIGIPIDTSPPPYFLPMTSFPDFSKILLLIFPIHPTDKVNPTTGQKIWETVAEVDARFTYMLSLGGPMAQGVGPVLAFPTLMPEPPPANHFDPAAWNKHLVGVINEDGSTTLQDPNAIWFQPLGIAPPGFTH